MTCAVLASDGSLSSILERISNMERMNTDYSIFLYKFVFRWLKTYFPQAEIVNPEGVHSTVPGLIIQIQNQE